MKMIYSTGTIRLERIDECYIINHKKTQVEIVTANL